VSVSELKPVYLIIGTDVPKIAVALRRLRARFEPGSIEQVQAESTGGAEVVDAANALGLFGGGERLVVVHEIEAWKKDDVEAVIAYVSSPTPGSVLALVGDPSRHTGLEAACQRAGDVLRYDLPTRKRGRQEVPDYAAWVQGAFEKLGVPTSRDAAERLVALIGDDLVALQTEVDKLAAWSAGELIGPREVESLVAPTSEANMFAVGDSWGSRDAAAALAACESALLHDEPFRIAGRFADHVRAVRAVQHLLEEDLGTRQIAERLGLKEYPARKRAGQAANFTARELGWAISRLASLDHALKGGSRLDPVLEFERALAQVTLASDTRHHG
jgi:DNA polymerase-3 subunit delta